MAGGNKCFRRVLVCVVLVLGCLAVYWPVRSHDFVNFDDGPYVTENPHVRPGFTWEGLGWAFGRLHGDRTYWHPVAWVSHMADCQLFGLQPGGHHLVNVFFHAGNTLLVFLVFLRLTGAGWRCAALAGLFALHPLQVDTVAWVAERKNLLSTLFTLLAIGAYTAYVKRKEPRRPISRLRGPKQVELPAPAGGRAGSARFYLLSLGLYALGLMSKPVVVTVPLLLLLLDYWPLGRCRAAQFPNGAPRWRGLLLEKLPFLLLAAASSVMTILSHRSMGMLEATASLPFGFRLENALVAYGRYLGSCFWPLKLAVFYPLPPAWPGWLVAAAAGLLLGLSALAITTRRSRPYLLVGWLWFVASLIPFIGLIQVGSQAMADRFAYLAILGPLLAVVWAAAEAAGPGRASRLVPAAACLVLLLGAALSRRQVGYWANSVALFEHALAVTRDNYVAHLNLGNHLAKQGRLDEARRHLGAAARIHPRLPEAHYELGHVLLQERRTREGIDQYRQALQLRPDWEGVLNNLAWLLATHPDAQFRNGAEAVPLAERACELTRGTNLWLVSTLAAAYAEAGRFPEAVRAQQRVCDLAAQLGPDAAAPLRSRLALYRSAQPYHLSSPDP